MTLFDAADPRPSASPPAGPRRVTLVRLAGEIARAVSGVGVVAVEGEVHRPATSRGGWVFFTLRDRASQVTVVVSRPVAGRSRIVAGERVCIVGALEWQNDRGQVQLVAREVVPVGAGAVAALIAETRRRLGADGLLDRPRRRLPVLPERIGVVCGAEAAIRKDIESVVAARFPGYPVIFEETTVSGPGASSAIVDALARLAGRLGVALVILARGGGDATALLPWSSEEVCRAVAACAVPVVSAIGHDGDRPLCDEVADYRCGTPSIAAATVVPDRLALEMELARWRDRAAGAVAAEVDGAARRLAAADPSGALRAGVQRAGARVERVGDRLGYLHPRRPLARCGERLAALDWRRPAGDALGRAAGRLEADGRHLRALSPARTLERGYAVVTGPRGDVVRGAAAVSVGDRIEVRLAEGRLGARVEEVSGG